MADQPLHEVLDHIRRLAGAPPTTEKTDRQLLEQFVTRNEQAAFAALVGRHGALVHGVCRCILSSSHDVEDVFQATFLVLARKAATLPWQESVGPWLHAVAYRLAKKAQSALARRRAVERQAIRRRADDPAAEIAWREGHAILDEELQRLSHRYRAPLILCYWEDQTRDEAAVQLGWSLATLKRRLERGRKLLRDRLTRRGLTLGTPLFAPLVTQDTASAVSPSLLEATARAAAAFASGQAAGAASGSAFGLAQSVLADMFLIKVKMVVAVLVAVGTVLAGVSVLNRRPLYPLQPVATLAETRQPGGEVPRTGQTPDRTDAYGDPLPADALARLGTVRLRHGNGVQAVAFLPSGKALMSADWHQVCVWDAATGKELHRFGNPRGRQFQSIAFSADGRTVALTMSDGDIDIWNAATGEKLSQYQAGRFPQVVLSPAGKTFALEENDRADLKSLSLWNTATGKVVYRLMQNEKTSHTFVFSADTKTLVVADSDDASISLWEVATGKIRHQISNLPYLIGGIALAPDGKTLAASTAKKFLGKNATGYMPLNDILVLDVASSKIVHKLTGHTNGVHGMAFTPDGKTLVCPDWEQVHLWDVASGKELVERRLPIGRVGALAFSPEGQTLAMGTFDNTVRLWDLVTGRDKQQRRGPEGRLLAVAISPDGRTFATGGDDQVIRLWDRSTSREYRQLIGHTSGIWSLRFTGDQRTLISTGFDNTTRVWEVASGKVLRRFPGAVAALPSDEKTLVTVSEGKTVHVWDLATGRERRQWPAPQYGVVALGFNADSRSFFSLGQDRLVRLWDAATGKELRCFASHHFTGDSLDRLYCLAFSPDGTLVAFGGQVSPIALYDTTTGKEVRRLEPLPEAVSSLVFSPDSRTLASGDWTGGTVRLWEVATGQQFRRLAGHQGRVFGMAFSADGTRLITCNEDTTALVWDITGRRTKLPVGPLSAGDLEERWTDLASEDAVRAFEALGTLVVAPQQAVPYLRDRLRPVSPVDPKRLARLIIDLDSDSFSTRENATQELEKLAEAAEPALRRAWTKSSSSEVRRRVTPLLEKLDRSITRLRTRRALQGLEQIGNSEARKVLTTLSRGTPGAWVSREAEAGLKRLVKRPAP